MNDLSAQSSLIILECSGLRGAQRIRLFVRFVQQVILFRFSLVHGLAEESAALVIPGFGFALKIVALFLSFRFLCVGIRKLSGDTFFPSIYSIENWLIQETL